MRRMESEQQRICRQRISQVFDYLKALNEHRNPAVRRIQEQPGRWALSRVIQAVRWLLGPFRRRTLTHA